MAIVNCNRLEKKFKTYKKDIGLKNSIKSLFKRDYKVNVAVHNFDLKINRGEIMALLGPNGSGKTTLMKMFTGLIVPSAGDVTICGHTPHQREKAFRKKIALVMGQKSQLWWDIPAMDSFRLLQQYYEIKPQAFKKRMDELVEYLEVKDLLHIHVRKLSLGERMKLELMASLLHEPEIIFLDEPTIGLDLVAQENIREFIKNYHRERHCTIILTSHYMADVEALCERLVLVFNGEKYFDGKLEQFTGLLEQKKYVNFTFDSPRDKNDPFWRNYSPIWNEHATQVKISLEYEQLCSTSQKILADYPVRDFFTEKVDVENVLRKIILDPKILQRGKLRE